MHIYVLSWLDAIGRRHYLCLEPAERDSRLLAPLLVFALWTERPERGQACVPR